MKHKYTKELLEPIINQSISIRQVLKTLELSVTGGNYSHINKLITKYQIDKSHFLGQGHNKGIPKYKYTSETFQSTVLTINGPQWTSHNIKLALYRFGLKSEQCETCFQLPIWNGEKLSLHLEHANGNHSDNRLDNLKILCPNCHSQTSTYAGK